MLSGYLWTILAFIFLVCFALYVILVVANYRRFKLFCSRLLKTERLLTWNKGKDMIRDREGTFIILRGMKDTVAEIWWTSDHLTQPEAVREYHGFWKKIAEQLNVENGKAALIAFSACELLLGLGRYEKQIPKEKKVWIMNPTFNWD